MSSRRIGNYQITDYIGSGGFGSVFKAEDVNTPGRVVAIKELHKKHTRNQVIKQRFFQEAVAMARLDHPNLPRLYTFGEDNGSYYLVMEFIDGVPMDKWLKAGSVSIGRPTASEVCLRPSESYTSSDVAVIESAFVGSAPSAT
jgi:serine/threonine protein kinase